MAKRLVMNPRIPKIGEKWFKEKDNGPWGVEPYPPVTIVDIKDSWVKFVMIPMRNRTMPVDEFIKFYKPVC